MHARRAIGVLVAGLIVGVAESVAVIQDGAQARRFPFILRDHLRFEPAAVGDDVHERRGIAVKNPADRSQTVGWVVEAMPSDATAALLAAERAFAAWERRPATERSPGTAAGAAAGRARW